jgi:hypothetical protein
MDLAPQTFSELVQSLYLRIDLAVDKLKQSSQMALHASIPQRNSIEGFNFIDIVNRPNVTTIKEQPVS